MRRIGLLSDTHSYFEPSVYEHFKDRDEIWHAGDIGSVEVFDKLEAFKPLKAVYGNIDGAEVRLLCPEHQVFQCEGIKVWMTHIGGYPGRYSAKIREGLLKHQPDLFVCGHSHILKIAYDKSYQMLTLNPGAIGKSGFHRLRTMLRFEIDGKDIRKMEIIEMGR